MSGARISRKGQPLVAYGLLVVGWIVVRSAFWDSPFPQTFELPNISSGTSIDAVENQWITQRAEGGEQAATHSEVKGDGWSIAQPLLPSDTYGLDPVQRDPLAPIDRGDQFSDGNVAAAHQLMWLAAMSQLPVPESVTARGRLAQSDAHQAGQWTLGTTSKPAKRWSLDAWIYLREGSARSLRSAGPQPSYGASQEGAVLRYRLADAGGHAVDAYTRFTHALVSPRDTEVAAGISAKPVAKLPLRVHGEMRAARFSGETVVRPSVFVTTGLHEELPYGVQMRGYAQAGYVGGKYATAFADGQLVADKQLAAFDLARTMPARLRVGAGAWGGAQEGAQRLDVGPSANLLVPVADAPVRLSVDYRVRVAGEAEPGSGVALTLSTGF